VWQRRGVLAAALSREDEHRATLSLTSTTRPPRDTRILRTHNAGPIFYMRKKVQKDLKDATDELARFDVNW